MEEFITEEADEVTQDEKVNKVEDLAAEIGWRADGELDADAYILKSRDIQDTMRTHIKDQKKQLFDLGSSVKELKTHNERVYKAEVSKLKTELTTLKQEKKNAIEEGDVKKVEELDSQIDGVKDAMESPAEEDAGNLEFNDWAKDNIWFNKDKEMTAYANAIADQHQGAPFSRISALATKKVKEMFPDKFTTTRKESSPVEGSEKRTISTKFTKADLTQGQRGIMSQFVKQGIMTEKAYLADIAKTQGA